MKPTWQVLADSFQDDPLNTFVFPDPEQRRRAGGRIYRDAVRLARLKGRIDEIPGKGVALWLPPGDSLITRWDMLRSGMLLWPVAFGRGAISRLLAADRDLSNAPGQAHDPDAWYLFMLAVDASARGQGMVRRLLTPVLEVADATGVPVRLETNSARNVPLYEHFGFRVTAHLNTPALLEQWTLTRPPARTR